MLRKHLKVVFHPVLAKVIGAGASQSSAQQMRVAYIQDLCGMSPAATLKMFSELGLGMGMVGSESLY